jgi:ATP-dependent protease HslVU (ClpYQ) peptidase subunit
MTCVIAMLDLGRVWFGSDARVTDEDGAAFCELDTPKFVRSGRATIGWAGNIAHSQVVLGFLSRHAPTRKLLADPLYQDRLRQHVRDRIPDACGAVHLIAVDGALHILDGALGVARMGRRYAAIGNGAPLALGAMHALNAFSTMPPSDRIRAALRAAEDNDASCGLPFAVESGPCKPLSARYHTKG